MTGKNALGVPNAGRRRNRSSLSCFVFNVVVIGGSSTGKTAMIQQFINSAFQERYTSTVSETYEKTVKRENDDAQYMLKILDLGGETRNEFNTIYNLMVGQGNIFFIVYSVNDRKSFLEVEKFFDDVTKSEEDRPTVIVGNKKDLNSDRQVGYKEGEDLASRLGCGFLEVSATNKDEIDDAFMYLLSQVEMLQIRDQSGVRKEKGRAHNVKGQSKKQGKKGDCAIM